MSICLVVVLFYVLGLETMKKETIAPYWRVEAFNLEIMSVLNCFFDGNSLVDYSVVECR